MDRRLAQAYLDLTNGYTDAKRHSLVAESNDWDTTTADAMAAVHQTILEFANCRDMRVASNGFRVLVETMYVKGYERGKKARDLTVFVAKEE